MLPSTDTDKHGNNVEVASELFAEHGNFIRAVILSKIKDEVQADDVFQDFFLSLVRKPVPDGVRNIRSYLYKAVINDTIDAIRRIEAYRIRIHKYSEQFDNFINKTRPENALYMEEEVNKVLELIKGRVRSSEYRAIALRYGNCHDIKEVAEDMQVSSRTVCRYISVGLKKIRQILKVEAGK